MRSRIAALVGTALLFAAPLAAATSICVSGDLYLVRHAEKAADGSDDPPLSELGQRNAQALVAWFEGKPLNAIYATHLRRTQQTALPLATARDLDLHVLPAGDTQRLVQRLRSRGCGETALVVGHSNTVPEIAAALGATPFSIPETEFGWVYGLGPGQTEVRRERYATEPAAVE